MEDNVLKQLAELKSQYQKGHVSVMVGAGFSKNACSEFPSWNGLLYDMVDELYQGEIESAFLRYLKLNPASKMSFDVFRKSEWDNIIYRIGPLNIVSEYIARKGFRESIEHYIEERIPYIDEENGEFRFAGRNKNKRIKINPEYFNAHLKLIEGQHWVKRYTTNYDRLLEYAATIAEKELPSITKAKNLSVFRDDPTIIKLHGDLHHPDKPRDFRFDGNPHQQYIISAEDYKNYPKEHEAFTQLMRISLLQGVFCLIGFSGDDPNFVNWIEWVRDILERDESQTGVDDGKDYKIYLIGISSDDPSPEKLLFYENHNIFYIPIQREDVLKEIGAAKSEELRDVFCHFFDYLEYQDIQISRKDDEVGQHKAIVFPDGTISFIQEGIVAEEKASGKAIEEIAEEGKKEYLSLWNKVYNTHIEGEIPKFSHSLVIHSEILERLEQTKIWNRFVNYCDQQKGYLSDIQDNEKLSENEARLAILALRDTGILLDNNLLKKISESGIGEVYLLELNKLVQRTKTLNGEWVEDGGVERFEQILRYLFGLQFGEAKKLLKDWNPTGFDILKKAMLLYFFGENEAKELLSAYLDDTVNAKERYYATRLLNLVEGVFPERHSLAKFENANVQDYAVVLSNYIKKVKENTEKIVRYGDGINEKIVYVGGEKPTKQAEAMAVLNFMIEAPAQPSYRNFYTNVNAENWYPVHQNLFEHLPYATLFYDIMCNDKKVCTRIGQDYSYSDKLRDTCLDKMLSNMLSALLSEETPYYLKGSILTISKEIFVSVPSAKWSDSFMQIWIFNVVNRRFDNKDDRLNDVLDLFVNKGLNSLKEQTARQRVIIDVLKNSKKDTRFAINCLYYLHVDKKDGNGNQELSAVVSEFVSQIDKSEEITIAGNLYRILSDEQKELAAVKCVEILQQTMGKSIDKVVYQSAQFFVKDNADRRRVYIESVCQSPSLWKSGVSAQGHYYSFTYLELTSFIRRIYLDKESLLFIYNKLVDSLNNITKFMEKHGSMPFWGDMDGLLSEMLSFMNYFEKRLESIPDFRVVYGRTKKTLKEVSGVKDTEDGLLSIYEDDVRDALSYIYTNRDILSHKDIVRYVNIVVNRVLMRNSDGLDTCTAYLRLFLNEGIIGKDDEALMEGLVSILDRYNKDIAQECNMNLLITTRDMAKIGKNLKKMGYASNGIDYWIELQDSGRFVMNF